MRLPEEPTVFAPDGSEVRVLLQRPAGSMAHFTLPPGATSKPVAHRTVEEIWYFLDGHGEMWRALDGREETVAVGPGVCVTIPVGASFQFRAGAEAALSAIAITMPPWSGDEEAYAVDGPWAATV
jgi:mannose-6-phosphate isomerase-like protein (cupin superfamily)